MASSSFSCVHHHAARGGAFLTGGCGSSSERRAIHATTTTTATRSRRVSTMRVSTTTTRAILVPQPPEPPKKPTWREQLSNVKQNGPSGTGRKNRGPRRTIKPHIKQDNAKPPPPNSVDAQLREWEKNLSGPTATASPSSTQQQQQQQQQQQRGRDGESGGDGASDGDGGDARAAPSSRSGAASPFKYGFNKRPQQLAETVSYSFLGQSTVQYPFSTADPADPASRGVYSDSKADKLAIELCVKKLAEAARINPDDLGDTTSYDALANVAMALYQSSSRQGTTPGELRQKMAGFHRRQLSVSMPPLGSLAMQSLLPSAAMSEVNATVVSEGTEWLFGPTTRETLAGPNGTEVTAVNVKKCRFLEATGRRTVCPPTVCDCLIIEYPVHIHTPPAKKHISFTSVEPYQVEQRICAMCVDSPLITGCAGACTSICKLPVQDAIKTEFGVPVYMQPNYKDYSCRMFFGMEPLPEKLDPALKYAEFERQERDGEVGGGGGGGVAEVEASEGGGGAEASEGGGEASEGGGGAEASEEGAGLSPDADGLGYADEVKTFTF